MQVNRYLKDKGFDHIDHALGRPVDPMGETYRNHFAVGTDNPLTAEFRASPYWEEGSYFDSKMAMFQVTKEGRQALAAHLKGIGDLHRLFVVTFQEYKDTVVAKTHSEAKYASYLRASDAWSELTFKAFCKDARVRLAA